MNYPINFRTISVRSEHDGVQFVATLAIDGSRCSEVVTALPAGGYAHVVHPAETYSLAQIGHTTPDAYIEKLLNVTMAGYFEKAIAA